MFVLARDEMLRAATGDRAGAPPRDRAPGRAAGGVGGAVGRLAGARGRRAPRGARPPAVSPSGRGARGPVAAPRPGGPPGPCHLARGASISWAGGQEQSRERRGRLTPPQLAIPIRRGAKSDVSPPPTHLWRDAVPPGPRVPARVCGCATIHTVTRRAAGGGARRVTPVPAHGL